MRRSEVSNLQSDMKRRKRKVCSRFEFRGPGMEELGEVDVQKWS
jgi:hypothetical protein